MKTASMVLGIVGGSLAILLALFLILGGSVFLNDRLWEGIRDSSANEFFTQEQFDLSRAMGGTIFVGAGVLIGVSGILGLIGGIIVKKANVASGVMMIIAAVLSLIMFAWAFMPMVLFILGAIFALKKERQSYPPYAPYPPYPYPQAPGNAPAPPANPQAPDNTPAPPTQPKK